MIGEFLITLLTILTAIYALYLLSYRIFCARLLSTRVISLYQLQAIAYLFNGFFSRNLIAILVLISYAVVGELAIKLTPKNLKSIKDLNGLFGTNPKAESRLNTIYKILAIVATLAFCIIALQSSLFIYTVGNEYLAEITSQLSFIQKIIIKIYQAALPGLFLTVFISKSNQSRQSFGSIAINALYITSLLIFCAYSLLNSRIALPFLLITSIILTRQWNYNSKKLTGLFLACTIFLSIGTLYRAAGTDLGKSIDFFGRIDCASAFSLSTEYMTRNPPLFFTAYRYDTIGIEAALFSSEEARSLIKSGEAGSKGYILRNVLFTKYFDSIWCAPIPHFLSFGFLSLIISPLLSYITIILSLSLSKVFQNSVILLVLLIPLTKFELDPMSSLISTLPICLFLVLCVHTVAQLKQFSLHPK